MVGWFTGFVWVCGFDIVSVWLGLKFGVWVFGFDDFGDFCGLSGLWPFGLYKVGFLPVLELVCDCLVDYAFFWVLE